MMTVFAISEINKKQESTYSCRNTWETNRPVRKLSSGHLSGSISNSWWRRQNAGHGLRSGPTDSLTVLAECIVHDFLSHCSVVHPRDCKEKDEGSSSNRFSWNWYKSDSRHNNKRCGACIGQQSEGQLARKLHCKAKRLKDAHIHWDKKGSTWIWTQKVWKLYGPSWWPFAVLEIVRS